MLDNGAYCGEYGCTSANSLVGVRIPFESKVPSTLPTALVLFLLPTYGRLHGGTDQVRRFLRHGNANSMQSIARGFASFDGHTHQSKEAMMARHNDKLNPLVPAELQDTVERLWRMYGVICALQIIAEGLRDSEYDSFASALEMCVHVLQAEWDAVMNTAYKQTVDISTKEV